MSMKTIHERLESLEASLRTTIIPPAARAQLAGLAEAVSGLAGDAPKDPADTAATQADLGLGDLATTLAKVLLGYGELDPNWRPQDTRAVELARGLAKQAHLDPKRPVVNVVPYTITDTEWLIPEEVADFIKAALEHNLESEQLIGDLRQQIKELEGIVTDLSGAKLAEGQPTAFPIDQAESNLIDPSAGDQQPA